MKQWKALLGVTVGKKFLQDWHKAASVSPFNHMLICLHFHRSIAQKKHYVTDWERKVSGHDDSFNDLTGSLVDMFPVQLCGAGSNMKNINH